MARHKFGKNEWLSSLEKGKKKEIFADFIFHFVKKVKTAKTSYPLFSKIALIGKINKIKALEFIFCPTVNLTIKMYIILKMTHKNAQVT